MFSLKPTDHATAARALNARWARASVLLLGLMVAIGADLLLADDTEIFFGRAEITGTIHPNVLFVIDTSGSMSQESGAQGATPSRMDELRSALHAVLAEARDVRVGLGRFTNPGGPILFPVTHIDADVRSVEGDEVIVKRRIRPTPGDSGCSQSLCSDDAMEQADGSVTLNEATLILGADEPPPPDEPGSAIELILDSDQYCGNDPGSCLCPGELEEVMVTVDDQDPEVTFHPSQGHWRFSRSNPDYYPPGSGNYYHDGNRHDGSRSVTFTPDLPMAGRYEVSLWWSAHSNRSTEVPVTIHHADGARTYRVNQERNGARFEPLGIHRFEAGNSGSIEISNDVRWEWDGAYVIVDAVQLRCVDCESEPVAEEPGVCLQGEWRRSVSEPSYHGINYFHDDNSGGGKLARFRPQIDEGGDYEVELWYTDGSNRARNALITVHHQDGVASHRVDQRSHGGEWRELGSYRFAAGSSDFIEISNSGVDGYLIVDAIRLSCSGCGASPIDRCEPDGEGLITLCHVPEGSPEAAETLTLPPAMAAAHRDHPDDYCGPCRPPPDRSRWVGLRFSDIAIPQGATVSHASLRFSASQYDDSDLSSHPIIIDGEDVGDAAPFSESSGDISTRAGTSATVSWQAEAWNHAGWTDRTPELREIVQEIVDRDDWCSGNALSLRLHGGNIDARRHAFSYDGDHSYDGRMSLSPLLNISYDASSVVPGSCGADRVITVRERLKQMIDEDLPPIGGTPMVDTLYEAAIYFRGGPVTYGRNRGNRIYHNPHTGETIITGGDNVIRGCSDFDQTPQFESCLPGHWADTHCRTPDSLAATS